MKYEVILEKGNYALIKRGSRMKEYAVVNGLNKESGDWSFSCGYYAYEYNGTPLANESEMLSNALNEFREKQRKITTQQDNLKFTEKIILKEHLVKYYNVLT